MLMHRSTALDNLTETIPPVVYDQKIDLLHAPFNYTTLFGGKLAKLKKGNTERASALTVSPTPASPSTSYTTRHYAERGKHYNYNPKRGGFTRKRGDEARRRGRYAARFKFGDWQQAIAS